MELAILGAVILYLIFCPPKHDPAIRLKEWNEKQKDKGHE